MRKYQMLNLVLISCFVFACSGEDEKNSSVNSADKNKNATETIAQQEIDPELPDFASFKDVKQKKKAFFEYFSEIAKQENIKVLAIRKKILIDIENATFDKNDEYYSALISKYNIDEESETLPADLLRRINAVPISLLLAQAASESAWGTSRFATLGNNFFGQWCFTKGCGIVPGSRDSDLSHEVAKFKSPADSVRAYIQNINSGHAYVDLRNMRLQLIDAGKNVTGIALAEGLIRYSERGEEYVGEIQSLIKYNKLSKYNMKDTELKIQNEQLSSQ